MKKLVNKVNKGFLVTDMNKDKKPSEKPFYMAFWLEADSQLIHQYSFPKEGYYMLTPNEYNKNIRSKGSVSDTKLFGIGDLHVFDFGRPAVLVRLCFEGFDRVVRLPITLLENALERAKRNPEDNKHPGVVNSVVDKIIGAVK